VGEGGRFVRRESRVDRGPALGEPLNIPAACAPASSPSPPVSVRPATRSSPGDCPGSRFLCPGAATAADEPFSRAALTPGVAFARVMAERSSATAGAAAASIPAAAGDAATSTDMRISILNVGQVFMCISPRAQGRSRDCLTEAASPFADGGPGIKQRLGILDGSERAQQDLRTFVTAQPVAAKDRAPKESTRVGTGECHLTLTTFLHRPDPHKDFQ
jgi:hypothetical protein